MLFTIIVLIVAGCFFAAPKIQYICQRSKNFPFGWKSCRTYNQAVFLFMKYTILINQKAAIDSGLDLDFIDLAIFDFVKDFSAGPACKKKYENEVVYTLLGWKLIIKQLPTLRMTTRQAVFNRMQKLVRQEILIAHPNNQVLGESWYAAGVNFPKLVFVPDNETSPTCQPNIPGPVNETLHNKTNKDNTISNNISERKIGFLKEVLNWYTANPGKYPKLMIRDFAQYWIEETKNLKNVKCRFEEQRFFQISLRLSTWFKKCKDWQLSKYWEDEKTVGTLNNLFNTLLKK